MCFSSIILTDEAIVIHLKLSGFFGSLFFLWLMCSGLCGFNGITSHIWKSIVNIYVNPAVLYRLESLMLDTADVYALDTDAS